MCGSRGTLPKFRIGELLSDEPVFGLYILESVPKADADEIASAFAEAIFSPSKVFPAYSADDEDLIVASGRSMAAGQSS